MVRDVAYVTIPGYRDEVLRVLKDRQVSGVPVVKNNRLVGMVTRADLLRNPEEDQIALLMTRNPYYVRPDSPLSEVASILMRQRIRRLPVVDDGRLVGIVTVADLVRIIADMGIEDPIDTLYEKGVVVVWSEMPLAVVGAVMEYADVQAVPVINSDLKLVGMVSDRDLIKSSIIHESVEKTDISSGSDDDEWSWESMRDTSSRYYQVSRIKLRDIPVKDVMVSAITAIKTSQVSECAILMRKKKIDQLPVVTSHQKLIGLLRDRDLMAALV